MKLRPVWSEEDKRDERAVWVYYSPRRKPQSPRTMLRAYEQAWAKATRG